MILVVAVIHNGVVRLCADYSPPPGGCARLHRETRPGVAILRGDVAFVSLVFDKRQQPFHEKGADKRKTSTQLAC